MSLPLPVSSETARSGLSNGFDPPRPKIVCGVKRCALLDWRQAPGEAFGEFEGVLDRFSDEPGSLVLADDGIRSRGRFRCVVTL